MSIASSKIGTGTLAVDDSAAGSALTFNGSNVGSGAHLNITGSSVADNITGGAGADTINAGDGNDTITGGAGADTLIGGNGDDTFNLANGDFAAGESIDGGTQTTADSIVLTNATTVDFTKGTITGIETLTGGTGADNVTMSATQWAGLSTINLGLTGTNVLNVVASG